MINYLPPKEEEFRDFMMRMFPEYITKLEDIKDITFQVTEDCCLKCSYCYQLHKTSNKMDFEMIKPFLEDLLHDRFEPISTNNTKGIIFDFIGGEPFMEIGLISQICDYLVNTMIEEHHKWLDFFCISICSNGILYFTPEVQDFIFKYQRFLSFSISIDGNKELHDACRVDLNGQGSYDRAMAAVHHYRQFFGTMPGTKMTISPFNVNYVYEAVLNLISEQYTIINLNCVYEDGWAEEHANILYHQLVQVSDYLLENDLYNKIFLSIFDEDLFCPMDEFDNQNWCGGVGDTSFSIDYKGNFFRCIRYMESSLNNSHPPLVIGDVTNGIGTTELYQYNLAQTDEEVVTRRSQSTDECFYCPIAKGCGWCSAYNYQVTGSVNKRVTFICVMHKARALANVYYWNKLYIKLGIKKQKQLFLPKEEALKIISVEEFEYLEKIGGTNNGV